MKVSYGMGFYALTPLFLNTTITSLMNKLQNCVTEFLYDKSEICLPIGNLTGNTFRELHNHDVTMTLFVNI